MLSEGEAMRAVCAMISRDRCVVWRAAGSSDEA